MHGIAARLALVLGLFFGAGGAAQADYFYRFETPDGAILQFLQTDFITANQGPVNVTLDAYIGSGTFNSTDLTTYYFSNVVLGYATGLSPSYVGFQADVGSIPTALGQFAVDTYTFVLFTGSGFDRTTANGGTLTLSEFDPPGPIPEPASWAMMALGLAGLAALRRRTRLLQRRAMGVAR